MRKNSLNIKKGRKYGLVKQSMGAVKLCMVETNLKKRAEALALERRGRTSAMETNERQTKKKSLGKAMKKIKLQICNSCKK